MVSCSIPVPVKICCPVCGSVHPSPSKRKWLVIAGIVAGALLVCGIIVVYRNRNDLLYTQDHYPVFGWLPEKPITKYPSETGEIPPRNINSRWI